MAVTSLRVSALAILLAAAATPQDPIIKVDVNLVNLLCTVHGKNNALIGNLEKKDFRVFEDGKEQEIKYFTRQTDLPLTIGLLVDVSGSQERLIDTEKRAANAFFSQVLRQKDSAFLISFGRDAELLQDYTSSTKLLREGLDQLRLSVPTGGLHPGPVPTMQSQAGTILYDAIYLAADEKMRTEVDRKVIVVITDGVDTGSKKSREDAIQAAQKSDAVIYSILYEDPSAYGPFGGGGGGEGELRRMSGDTGGRVFRVDRKNTLEDAFRELQEEMRSQYAISYSPTNDKRDGTFRKIEIRTASKDNKVQTRKGYYADPSN
jgi:VWFA-related protein